MAGKRIAVVGNGIAGYRAASTAKKLNKNCEVTILGLEPDPLYSACVLPDYIAGDIPRDGTFVKKLEDYRALGINCLFGQRVKEIDVNSRELILHDGRALCFDNLILATGSKPVTYKQPKKGIFELKTLGDADGLVNHKGERAAVVGSGMIGIEAAIGLRQRGYQVTLIARSARLLRRSFDTEATKKITNTLEKHGITVLLNEQTDKAIGEENLRGLKTDKREIECDLLVWALGMVPNVELAVKAGVALGECGGIKVNSHMETNLPGVFACGDCVETKDMVSGRPALNLLWHNANRQGQVAAYNSLGLESEYAGSNNLLNLNFFEDHVVSYGFTRSSLAGEPNKKVSVIEKEKEGSYSRLVLSDDRCVGAQFINPVGRPGLIWSLMHRKRSIKKICAALEDQMSMRRRPWMYGVRPFFQ